MCWNDEFCLLIDVLGGKLVYQSTKKRASGPKCPVTGKRIQGVSSVISGMAVFVRFARIAT